MSVLNSHSGKIGKGFQQCQIFLGKNISNRAIINIDGADHVAVLFCNERNTHHAPDFQIHYAVGFCQRAVLDHIAAEYRFTFIYHIVDNCFAKKEGIFHGGSIHIRRGVGDAHFATERMS